jgi:Rhodopirellula transposase DDE domain
VFRCAAGGNSCDRGVAPGQGARLPRQGVGQGGPVRVYDIAANTGWVNVGTDADTGVFAVESIHRWWTTMGAVSYPGSGKLLITADCGGSNGSRLWRWKTELAAFAAESGLDITVCHLPSGTSKWNKVEHRLSSAISRNWRGRPCNHMKSSSKPSGQQPHPPA